MGRGQDGVQPWGACPRTARGSRESGAASPSAWGFDHTPPWLLLKQDEVWTLASSLQFPVPRLTPRGQIRRGAAIHLPPRLLAATCVGGGWGGMLWAGEKIAVAPLSRERSICQARRSPACLCAE